MKVEKVEIYVEGPSDKLAMEALLRPLIEVKLQQGIKIEFIPTKGKNNDRGGDAKKDLLTKIPIKTVNIISNIPNSIVVVIPDLYPKNKGFPHETLPQLEQGILQNFQQTLQSKGINDHRFQERFKVFCFKHDLESLILAAESQLSSRIDVTQPQLPKTWTIPVEDQNHDIPPKKIVEEIFKKYGKSYKESVDAPIILANARYQEIAKLCPQAFKPFVQFLENL